MYTLNFSNFNSRSNFVENLFDWHCKDIVRHSQKWLCQACTGSELLAKVFSSHFIYDT